LFKSYNNDQNSLLAERGRSILDEIGFTLYLISPQCTNEDHHPCRQLFEIGLRNPIRTVHGLLPDPDLHTQRIDRHHFVGELLAEQVRDARPRLVRRYHRVDHDHAHVVHQRSAAEDIVRQVHRRVPGHVFRHGFCLASGSVIKLK